MAFKDDEFNHINIVNEGTNPNFEFGATQDAEFTSFSDNVSNIRDEVNDNPQSNGENKPKEEEKEQKKQESSKENSSNKNNNSSGKSGSSSGSSAGGTAGAVATAAGAAVVTVSVISATIGINMFISAKCKVNKMDLTPVSLQYDLDLEEVGENEHFVIKMANDALEYNEVNELQEGPNEGYFVNLTPSTDYVVSVYNTEFFASPIYLETITTPAGEAIKNEVKISFDSNGREGSMTSMNVKTNGKYVLPVCIFLPKDDEIFGGWKVNGEGKAYQPGDAIDLTDDTVLVASWDKLPTTPSTFPAGSSVFNRLFPEQPSEDITSTERFMNMQFNLQNVYHNYDQLADAYYLNFTESGGFVSCTLPFGGVLSSIEVKTSSQQSGIVNYTVVYSASPIYEKTTESGETHGINYEESYIFNCSNPDARYFCLSVEESDSYPSLESITFTYNVVNKEDLSFKVYFDANGGTGEFGPYTISEENYGTIPNVGTGNMDVPFTAPGGKEFAGWNIRGVGDLLEPGRKVGLSQDITLIAQWKDKAPATNHLVIFNSNRGSSVQTQVVEEGNCAVRPDDPTRNGYLFLDWYSDEQLTNPFDFAQEINSDLALFAGWKPDVDLSMYINYVDTLSSNPTNKLSFSYTKTDTESVITDYSLEIDGDIKIDLTVGSLSDASSSTTKTIDIDNEKAATLGTGIVNYTMKGIDSYGDSYDIATGSLSMSRSQRNNFLFAYIGGQQLEADNSGKTFPVYLSGTESATSSSSTYYIPFKLDYAYYSSSSPELYLRYTLDGSTYKNTSFYYTSPSINLSFSSTSTNPPIFDTNTKQATIAEMYFTDSSSNRISDIYENVTLQASDSRYVGGFSLRYMLNPSSRSIMLHGCGERGTNPDNLDENYTYTTLGVNNEGFEAVLELRLLSKAGTIEKEYNIDLASAFKAKASSSTSSSVNFDFIDIISGEDKNDEFVELAKRYVCDAKLSIRPGDGTSFECTSYESYSFR